MPGSADPAGATWAVRFLDGTGTVARDGTARIDGDALALSLADGTRLDFAIAGVAIATEPADGARGILVPLPGSAARIGFAAPELAAALRARLAHRRGRRAAAAQEAWRLLAFVLPGLAAIALVVMVAIPVLSDRIAAVFPVQSERRFGAVLATQLALSLATRPGTADVCRGTPGRAALDALLARLAAAAGPLPHPLALRVVASEQINAFALPGGQVLLLSGLIDFAASPDEIAGVLAHEIAHVARRDPLRATIRSAALAALAGTVAGDPYLIATLAAFVVRSLGLAHPQAAEAMADAQALDILAAAGVSAQGLADFFARMETRAGPAPDGPLAHLSTHPPGAHRTALARAAAQGRPAMPPALDDTAWGALRAACGLRAAQRDASSKPP